MIKNSALLAMREENVGPFTRGDLHLILDKERENKRCVCVCVYVLFLNYVQLKIILIPE